MTKTDAPESHAGHKLGCDALLVSRFVGQRLAPVGANVTSEDLLAQNGLIEEGRVTPVIDRTSRWSMPPRQFATSRQVMLEAR